MKYILDELLKVILAMVVLAISYKYYGKYYEIRNEKDLKRIETKKPAGLLDYDVTQLPMPELFRKLIEMREAGIFNDKIYFLNILDNVIKKGHQNLIDKFFIPAANDQTIGAVLFKCIRAQYYSCAETILKFDPLVEYEGKNVLHMIAELDKGDFMYLVPRDTLYLHLRDNSGEVPMKYVYSESLARLFGYIFYEEIRRSPYKKELFAHYNYMEKSMTVKFANQRQRINAMFIDPSWYPKSLEYTLTLSNKKTMLEDSFNRLNALGSAWYSHRSLGKFTILLVNNNPIEITIKSWIISLVETFFRKTLNSKIAMLPLFIRINTEANISIFAPTENYSPKYYMFAGSIIALALKLGISINVEFIPSIYRMILGLEPYRVDDLAIQNPLEYKGIKDSREAYINFRSVMMYDYETRTNVRIKSLRDLDERVDRYVSKVLYYEHKEAIDAFAEGFRSKIPREITKYLDLTDLKNAIKGTFSK